MRARGQLARRLVEPDVTVGADSEDDEVDSAGGGDRAFVALALGVEIGGAAVEEPDVLGRDVDVREEVLVHETAIAAGSVGAQADEFIEIEGADA